MNSLSDPVQREIPASSSRAEPGPPESPHVLSQWSESIVDELVEIAQASGIQIDRAASRAWLDAVADAVAAPGEFSRSIDGQFGGHELALIDFDPAAAERFRRIGRLIESPPTAGVRSALAIAGSAAQGRIQPFPADADYFERVHISAPRREDAIALLARLLRDNVERVGQHPGFHFDEVYLGLHAGLTLCWTPKEFAAGSITRTTTTGRKVELTWEEAALEPGFVKIDWTLDDPVLGGPGRVSKVIDATWETPDGGTVSLDGAIDADFQQVYLDAAAADLAAALTSGLTPGSREHYVYLMEREVAKYCDEDAGDYAKVAKRLYNLCRLTGRYAEAAFVRELFDEPPARLHQIRVRIELVGRLSPSDRLRLAHELQELANADPVWCGDADRGLLREWAETFRADVSGKTAAAAESANEAARRLVSAAFARGLRAYAPIGTLIDDIRSRHAATTPPR